MSSRCREYVPRMLGCALAIALPLAAASATARDLRVCADPGNLPYSNAAGEGFENRIAQLIAADLHAQIEYYWLPQWRGFTRKTLLEGHCDVIPGIPVNLPGVRTTAPYYHGDYALVFRADRIAGLTGLDDPRMRTLRIGLPVIGIDAVPAPPGRALARRGIFDNVVGFPVIGDKPAAERLIEALARNDIDVAIVWSPQAGYYMARQGVPLAVSLLNVTEQDPVFEFAIAMAVRPGDVALQRDLDASLARVRPQVDAVLREFRVVQPLDDTPAETR
jgi:mxaJ protein